MRKLFGLLVIVAMVAFAACGNGKKEETKAPDSTNVQAAKPDSVKAPDSTTVKTEAAPTEAAKK